MATVTYDFNTNNAPTVSGAGVTATDLGGGANIGPNFGTANAVTGAFGYPTSVYQVSAGSTTIAAAITTGSYFPCTITAAGMAVTRIQLKAARGGAGTPRSFAIRSSADGYATDIVASTDIPTVRTTLTSYDITGLNIPLSGSPTTFRFYIATPTNSSTIEFDDVIFTVSAASSTVTGTASVAPSAFTSAAVAKVKVKALTSVAPNAFISAAAAKALVHGLGSGTLNAFTSSSIAKAKVKGTASAAPSAFTSTSGVKVKVKAAAGPALSAFTLTSAAHIVTGGITATASIQMSPFTSAAADKALVKGLGSGTLNAFSASATAKAKVKTVTSATLSAFSGQSVAKAKVRASAQPALNAFGSQAAAKLKIKAAATVGWGPFTLSAFIGGTTAPPVPASRVIHIGKVRSTVSAGRPQQTILARGRRW